MKKLELSVFEFKKNEVLSRAQMKNIIGGGPYPEMAGPGGDNGNPCPQFCEPVGGVIYCVNQTKRTVRIGNCNEYPYDADSHNACVNVVNGNFWC